MSEYNLQEDFNTVWNGARAQDFSLVFQDGTGVLENASGQKCNIGHLCRGTTKNQITTQESGDIWDRETPQRNVPCLHHPQDTVRFYWAIQEAHDSAASPTDHEERLRAVAAAWELTIPNG